MKQANKGNVTLKELITNLISNEVKADLSSTALFVKALKEYKGCISHKSTLDGLKEIVDTVADEQKATKAFTQRAYNVLVIASKCDEFKLHTLDSKTHMSSTKLFFYNISKAINLLDYVRVNRTEDIVTAIKNKLNKVRKVSDKRMYNDSYAKELKLLYREYKVALNDEGSVIEVSLDNAGLKRFINSLDDTQREYIRLMLVKNEIDAVDDGVDYTVDDKKIA